MKERVALTDSLREMGFREPNTGIVEEPWEYWQISREDAAKLVGAGRAVHVQSTCRCIPVTPGGPCGCPCHRASEEKE